MSYVNINFMFISQGLDVTKLGVAYQFFLNSPGLYVVLKGQWPSIYDYYVIT